MAHPSLRSAGILGVSITLTSRLPCVCVWVAPRCIDSGFTWEFTAPDARRGIDLSARPYVAKGYVAQIVTLK